MLNAIGLPDAEQKVLSKNIFLFLKITTLPLLLIFGGKTHDDYGRVELLDDEDNIHAYEINLSCPNIKEGGSAFGTDIYLFKSN